MQKKKASTKNYQAANSMHVLFRRRVKMIFYTNIFLSRLIHQTPNCFGREESRKKTQQAEPRAKKIFMHSIYILINSHVQTTTRRLETFSFPLSLSLSRPNACSVERISFIPGASILLRVPLARRFEHVMPSEQQKSRRALFQAFLVRSRLLTRQINCNAKIGKSKYRSELCSSRAVECRRAQNTRKRH